MQHLNVTSLEADSMSVSLVAAKPVEPLYVLDDPIEEGHTYFLDAMHYPDALSPFFQSIHGHGFSAGFSQAAAELNAPIITYVHLYRNNFQFKRIVPREARNEEHARQIGESAEQTMKSEIAQLRERWEQEHLPRLLDLHARLRQIIASAPAEAATPETVDELLAMHAEFWTIHWRIVLPMLLGMQIFDELYADLFGADADSHALTAGNTSESVRGTVALAGLASFAQSRDLASTLLDTPIESIPGQLADSEAGRNFLTRLSTFHEHYGLRQDLFDFITPTWQENPAITLANVRNYLRGGRDVAAEHEQQAERARAAADAARAQLAVYPQAVREQFDALLHYARNCAFLQEEHNFYIDQVSMALIRLAFLPIGQHLTEAGRIAGHDDIFMLHSDEIRFALLGGGADLRAIVRDRRASYEASQRMTPPPYIGAPPAGPAPMDNPLARGLSRFYGTPPEESADPNILNGTAGSRGSATGTAFIAKSLQEATTISPGQILVAVTTMPSWTPLFGIAAAIVTQTGGPLSHCAIVAREYGIPAVVGAHGATERIRHGQTITVDGTNGEVTLHQ
jgi:rifampicin phosphotransferase